MISEKPAVSLAAVPGKRRQIIELAKEIEARGFAGIYCPSIGDGLALCEAIAMVTDHIEIGTAITPIYFRQALEYAATVAFINEIAPRRFRFGIGVSHAPALTPRGLDGTKPLADTRQFVEQLKAAPRVGELPPIILATLREKMIRLADEIGDGIIFANGARSHMQRSLANLSAARSAEATFFIGNMIPTCIDQDIERARAVNRKTLSYYVLLPNYRNYWKTCGYEREMSAVETCVAQGKLENVAACLSDEWLDDTTLSGPPERIKEELAKWYEAGVKTPILVPSSTSGGQINAFGELFALFE